jgi:hypothetical protein
MKSDPTENALAALDEVALHTPAGRKQLAKAFASRSNRVAAKAARITGEAQWPELTPDLAAAFDRLLARGAEVDKGCVALSAMARTLFTLDCEDHELFLKGMRHVQMEPVWGGSIDTAAELRGLCAMGLVGTRFAHKLRVLVDLLVDKEWQARAGAVRAITTEGSEAASLLLRLKILSGDQEPEVLADCFTGILSLDGSDAMPLVTSFSASTDPAICEAALLALGASRRSDAVDYLCYRFAAVADRETRSCILLALSTSRTDAALEFILGIIRDANPSTSAMAVSAMELHRDEMLRVEVERALQARSPEL